MRGADGGEWPRAVRHKRSLLSPFSSPHTPYLYPPIIPHPHTPHTKEVFIFWEGGVAKKVNR